MREQTYTEPTTEKQIKAEFSQLAFAERTGSYSLKYDALKERFGCDNLLPLWVADMDCRSPSVVQQALSQRLEHGIYGYSSAQLAEASKAAICHWLVSRHSVENLPPNGCLLCNSVLEALAVCIEIFCTQDQAIILNRPAYNCFYSTIDASGRSMVENYLTADNTIDFELLEHQIRQNNARIFLLCSPHNPTGKVWSRAEILQLLHLCRKYDLYLISDEIHFDLIYSGHEHLCILREEFSRVHDKLIFISAPSKTFNIPALRCAYLASRNANILSEIRRFYQRLQLGEISLFGHLALTACYTETVAIVWLEELLLYLEQNRNFLWDYLSAELPELQHRKPDATYLYWVDCRNFLPAALHGDPEKLRQFFIGAGLALGWGHWYHGSGWVRVNFACSHATLRQALTQWKEGKQGKQFALENPNL